MKFWHIRPVIVVIFMGSSVFAAYLQKGAQRAAKQAARSVSTPVSYYSIMAARKVMPPAQTRQAPTLEKESRSYSTGDKKDSYQKWWQQERVKDAIKKALGITGVVAIAAIIAEANEIADFARTTFFMHMFDEDLISDEFSRAIVEIYDQRGGKCSGCIVASEKNPGLYFVLTAAHCVSAEGKDYVHIKHPNIVDDSDKDITIELTQILIDRSTDVAVFLIPLQEIRKFQEETGVVFPAIPAKQLASIEPRKNEVVLLQGYPGNVLFKNFYREKFIPQTNLYTREGTNLISIEKHSPEPLSGASGAPYIVIRDNKPEIQGIHSAGQTYTTFFDKSKRRTGLTYGAGFGKLPYYLQEAEQNARNLQETEKNMSPAVEDVD